MGSEVLLRHIEAKDFKIYVEMILKDSNTYCVKDAKSPSFTTWKIRPKAPRPGVIITKRGHG